MSPDAPTEDEFEDREWYRTEISNLCRQMDHYIRPRYGYRPPEPDWLNAQLSKLGFPTFASAPQAETVFHALLERREDCDLWWNTKGHAEHERRRAAEAAAEEQRKRESAEAAKQRAEAGRRAECDRQYREAVPPRLHADRLPRETHPDPKALDRLLNEEPPPDSQGWYLHGPTGNGKTSAMSALYYEDRFEDCLWIDATALSDRYEAAPAKSGPMADGPSREELLEELVGYDWLFIDNFFFDGLSAAYLNFLRRVIDKRNLTVITAQQSLAEALQSISHDDRGHKLVALIRRLDQFLISIRFNPPTPPKARPPPR